MLAFNDERVLRINEVVSTIVYVKMCGWCPKVVEWSEAPSGRTPPSSSWGEFTFVARS
jgi:hypothetical protein